MKFWQNPEIKKTCLRALIITAILLLSASLAAGVFYWQALLISVFWHSYYLFSHYLRYKKIYRLNQDLDLILQQQKTIALQDYREGELSILATNIEKLLSLLYENQELLLRDKNYLADALADISHQLRTPLASLNLLVRNLQQDLSPQEKTETIHKIYRLLERISRLIESLLLMSRLDAGAVKFKDQTCDVRELLKKALQPLEISLELKGIDIVQKFENQTLAGQQAKAEENQAALARSSQTSFSFACDELWTVEALSNLLKNCMEHCPAQNARIMISVRQNPLYLEIVIEDNGAGFSTKDLPYLFQRFYRGDNAAPSSIGIGLALAKQIINLQGGQIKAENVMADEAGNPSVSSDATPLGARFQIRFYPYII